MTRGTGWRLRSLPTVGAALLLLVSVASCQDRSTDPVGSAEPSDNSPSTLATDLGTERTPVFGTTTCARSEGGSRTRGGLEILEEHFSCTDEMSDPRVSGSDEVDVETVFRVGDDDNLASPWTAELVVSNDGGNWRGTCTGALESMTDPMGWPTNYGICTLAGEGGYTGLSYVYLLAGGNAELVYAGWIEPAA